MRWVCFDTVLQEMKKRSDLDEGKLQDLQAGSEATSAILARANQAIDKETRAAAQEDLRGRVEDWKGHQMERFGDLLVYGTYTVLKGEAAKEVEREVRITFNIVACISLFSYHLSFILLRHFHAFSLLSYRGLVSVSVKAVHSIMMMHP